MILNISINASRQRRLARTKDDAYGGGSDMDDGGGPKMDHGHKTV